MKAIQIREYKDLKDFEPKEVSQPKASSGQVLIKIAYAGINPSDLANSQGYFAEHTTLPRIIGRDFAGQIVDGPQACIGQTVMGSGGDIGFTMDGTFAEYLVIPESGAVEVPQGLELPHAASLGVPFLAALACVDSFPRDLKDKTLLLIGGAGAVGSAATVIARHRGGLVTRTILKASDVEALAPELRAGPFMDLGRNPDLFAQTNELTNGIGYDYIVNLVGGATFEPALKCLTEYGRMACVASPGQPRVEFNLLEFYRKNLSVYGLNTALDGVVESADRLRKLFAEFQGDAKQLACLGETQLLPFAEARQVLENALAKKYRKPVFKF